MKWTTATALVIALGVLGFVTKAIYAPTQTPTREKVALIRDSLDDPGTDYRRALRVLDLALSGPEAAEDDALAIEILRLRADVYTTIGAFTDARGDLERIQGVYGVRDPVLELTAAELQARDGQVEEAWQRVGRLLGREPELGEAWLLRGRLERDRARQHEERALIECDVALVTKEADDASELVRELSARDLQDPARGRLSAQLREIFLPRNETELHHVLEEIEEASRLHGEARHSFGRAIQCRADAVAARAFLDLLVQGGRPDLAVEFGLAAIQLDELRDDGAMLESLLSGLRELGQDGRALQLLEGWPWRERATELSFNRAACLLYYDNEEWRELSGPTSRMKEFGGPLDRSFAHFYQGLMHHHRALQLEDSEKHEKAISTLQDFIDGQALSPVPDATGIAYLALAGSYRALGQERLERQSLMGAIEAAPKLSGEAYLRLVELQRNSANIGFRIPEANWTLGMSLLPERTSELFPTWEALGAASLAADELEYKDLVTRVEQAGHATPTRRVGPYTLHRLARTHLKSGNFLGALTVSRDLYEEYPGLLPALDTLIDTLLARGSRLQAALHVMERMRLVGADERSRAYLDQVGFDVFDAEQRLELVRIDALGLGRELVAEYHLERGQPELALRALRVVEGEEPSELDILRARALLELDRGEPAADAAAKALQVERLRTEALEALVRARLLGEDDAPLVRLVDGLLAEDDLERDLSLRIVDHLIGGGRPELAARVLARLDSEPETRGGDVLLRIALACALSGDREAAAEALERAEAFLGDGQVELTRLFLTLEARDWLQLPAHVTALDRGAFEQSELQVAILALLGEDLDAGLALATGGLEEEPRSAEWALVLAAAQLLRDDELELPSYFGPEAVSQARRFLRGDGEAQRDPREALGLLLAVEQPGWGLWVLPRLLRAYREDGGSLWPFYLAARAERSVGQTTHSLANVQRLTTTYPGFGPGWDELESARRRAYGGDAHHPEVLLVREGRLRALGAEHAGTDAQLAMDRATARVAAGELGEAIADLGRFIDRADSKDRELPDARAFLAHLQSERGDYAQAAENYRAAILARNPRRSVALVPALLKTLTRSTLPSVPRRSRLESNQVTEYLDAIAEYMPNDPLIALAAVRHELARDARNLSLAVNRANGALEGLRLRTEGQSLDQLRPGASAAWAEFLRELSPQSAIEILTEDLELTPGNVTLWLELARAHEARGDTAAAESFLRTALDLSDSPEAHEEMARTLARRGGDARAVEAHLARSDDAQGRRSSYRTQYLRARTDLQRTSRRPEKIAERLADLWDVREEFADEVPPLELGLTYASALLQRLERNDAKILNKLIRTMQPYAFGDPYAVDTLEAYGGVARELRVQLENEQAAAELEEAASDEGADSDGEDQAAGKRGKRDQERPRKRERRDRPAAADTDDASDGE